MIPTLRLKFSVMPVLLLAISWKFNFEADSRGAGSTFTGRSGFGLDVASDTYQWCGSYVPYY